MTTPSEPSALTDVRAANLAENPFAGQGPVLLDIGGDVGAIVLRLPASMHGAEIEILSVEGAGEPGHPHTDPHDHQEDEHPDDDRSHAHDGGPHHRHVAVVERPTAAGPQFIAVFPDVHEGSYLLREHDGSVSLRLEVTGGTVTEADWPE